MLAKDVPTSGIFQYKKAFICRTLFALLLVAAVVVLTMTA